MLLPQRQQFLNFVQREPQFLGVPHEYEVMNLLSVEQAISARAAIRTPEESEFLIEADRVHANAVQLRCLTDVTASAINRRINPGVKSRVKENSRKRIDRMALLAD